MSSTEGFSPQGQAFVWLPVAGLDTIAENCTEPGTAMLVYLALYRIANQNRCASFTRPLGYIAKLACVSRRTVVSRLEELEKAKLVTVQRGKDQAGDNAVNTYQLPSLKSTTQRKRGSAMDALPSATNTPLGSATVARGSATEFENRCTVSKEEKELKNTPTPFERFYNDYPRKVGKDPASKAFKKNKCAAILETILASIEAHKVSADWLKDGGQYIPHPATFLNQHRWEDELTVRPGATPSAPARQELNVIDCL